MAVEITMTWRGNTRCEITHGPSGAALATVAPVDNGGDGSSFSPTDLVASGLCSCLLTIMGMTAAKLGVDLGAATARIEKHMTADPRRIGRLPIEIHIPVDPTPDQRAAIEDAGRGCPVCRSLSPDIAVELTIHWAAQSADAK